MLRQCKDAVSPVLKADIRNGIHNIRSCLVRLVSPQTESVVSVLDKYNDSYKWTAISRGSCYYGIEDSLRKYSNASNRLYAAIEHGLYLGTYVNKYEADLSGLPCLLTYGTHRKDVIAMRSDTPVVMCGPYIHYAIPSVNDDELAAMKQSYGRTLVVFPTHSIENTAAIFDVDYLIKKVSALAHKLDIQTTIYCLYFHDVNQGLAHAFTERGEAIACAGHRSDPLFLSRLRSLISLSDCTASNAIGTHVGYSEYLGKPHYYLDSRIQRDHDRSLEKNALCNTADTSTIETDEIIEALKSCDTQYKRDVLNSYWGFDQIKTPVEIKQIFDYSKIAYNGMKEGISQYESWEPFRDAFGCL